MFNKDAQKFQNFKDSYVIKTIIAQTNKSVVLFMKTAAYFPFESFERTCNRSK